MRAGKTVEPWGRGSASRDKGERQFWATGPPTPSARAEEGCLVVLGPEAIGGAVGCWVGKASPSTTKSWCFLEQTLSTVGGPLCWGAIWLHLTRPSQLRDAPTPPVLCHCSERLWASGSFHMALPP